MTIEELLEELDGNGLVITDQELIIDTMAKLGYAIFDEIAVPYTEKDK